MSEKPSLSQILKHGMDAAQTAEQFEKMRADRIALARAQCAAEVLGGILPIFVSQSLHAAAKKADPMGLGRVDDDGAPTPIDFQLDLSIPVDMAATATDLLFIRMGLMSPPDAPQRRRPSPIAGG